MDVRGGGFVEVCVAEGDALRARGGVSVAGGRTVGGAQLTGGAGKREFILEWQLLCLGLGRFARVV